MFYRNLSIVSSIEFLRTFSQHSRLEHLQEFKIQSEFVPVLFLLPKEFFKDLATLTRKKNNRFTKSYSTKFFEKNLQNPWKNYIWMIRSITVIIDVVLTGVGPSMELWRIYIEICKLYLNKIIDICLNCSNWSNSSE